MADKRDTSKDGKKEHADKRRKLFAMGVELERVNVQPGYVMLNVVALREHNRLTDVLAAAYPRGTTSGSFRPLATSFSWK